jgi:ElaB/YqjD/DUF883 family membrane-anchored ribosome-binding protein
MDPRESSTRINRPNGGEHNSDEILSDIRHTRGRMDQTLDELGVKLQPRHLLDEVIDYFWKQEHQTTVKAKDAAGRAGRKVVEEIREHPLPSLLIGAGIVWLLAEQKNRGRVTGPGYGEGLKQKAGEIGEGAKERARQGVESIRERTSEMSHEAREKLGAAWESTKAKSSQMQEQLTHQIEDAYSRAGDTLRETARAQPMAIGLGCLAIGVIAGVLAPRTRTEDEMMGGAADRIKEEGKEAARELAEQGKHVAERALEAGKEEAREQGLTAEGIKAKAEEKVHPNEPPMGPA